MTNIYSFRSTYLVAIGPAGWAASEVRATKILKRGGFTEELNCDKNITAVLENWGAGFLSIRGLNTTLMPTIMCRDRNCKTWLPDARDLPHHDNMTPGYYGDKEGAGSSHREEKATPTISFDQDTLRSHRII